MNVIHTSPAKIEKIRSYGLFADCLFFSNNEYVMTAAEGYYVYALEIQDDEIIEDYELYDDEIIAEIADNLGVDNDIAESLLDGSQSANDLMLEDAGEADWWIQSKQGECAKKMGYKACQSTDEQGTVYIVPMMGRESDLKLISKRG